MYFRAVFPKGVITNYLAGANLLDTRIQVTTRLPKKAV